MPESTKELSGRELDAAVAECVMGWQRQDGYNYWMTFSASGTFKLHALIVTWKPSESIEAAMQVVEKMRERGFAVVMQDSIGKLPWYVEFESGSQDEESATSDSLPEAICRCALAAIGSKSESG